jgi:hypothetical protein
VDYPNTFCGASCAFSNLITGNRKLEGAFIQNFLHIKKLRWTNGRFNLHGISPELEN